MHRLRRYTAAFNEKIISISFNEFSQVWSDIIYIIAELLLFFIQVFSEAPSQLTKLITIVRDLTYPEV